MQIQMQKCIRRRDFLKVGTLEEVFIMEEITNLDIFYRFLKEQEIYNEFINFLDKGVDINE